MMSMGIEREKAEMGLRNTDNNVERAIDWIFSHPDGEDPVPEAESGDSLATSVKDGSSR